MIYLDANASTPCAPEVVEAMLPYWEESFANASSTHRAGSKAHQAIIKAREQVAKSICAMSHEVVFTSGSTEGSNIIFLGLLLAKSERRKIVLSPIEHKAVLESAKCLAGNGFEIVYLPVTQNGVVDLNSSAQYIDEQTALVVLQAANNEIGTIQPVKEIAALAHAAGAFFYVDAVQALGKITVSMQEWECDFATFSAHKIYGPKGVGALYVRGGPLAWPWAKPLSGGGQEGGLRPGTLNVPGIVGFGRACELITQQPEEYLLKLRELRDFFEAELVKKFDDSIIILGQKVERIPNTSGIIFEDFDVDFIKGACGNIAFANGAACSDGTVSFSHVLTAIAIPYEKINNFARFSFSKNNTYEDVFLLLKCFEEVFENEHKST